MTRVVLLATATMCLAGMFTRVGACAQKEAEGTAKSVSPDTCPIVPLPKVYRESGSTVALGGQMETAIVVGAKASEPERYAAERLQTLIKRRFKRDIPVCGENDATEFRQVILLGQRTTNVWLDRLCQSQKIDLSSDSLGHDGFVIECFDDKDRKVVVIGGSNPRSVIYGQFAFFDTMRYQDSDGGDPTEVVFPEVSIHDWSSIPWRGRPHSVLRQHLVPGAMDAYVRARLNYTDVRDDPRVEPTLIFPARKASMGLPPGVPLDVPLIKRHLHQSHRRGFFVYGTVACSVDRDGHDAVIRTYEELIELGVDGLWLSFDDTGADKDSPELIRRVLELGARHDMTGQRIAVTPPSGSYQTIDKPFNRTGAAIPGFSDVEWFFTRVPCQDDVDTARRIGITRLPAWWHNLVRFPGGFLHNGDVATTMRRDGKPGYLNMQPLSSGWHYPTYEQISDAPQYTHSVLLWGVCNGWPEEYQLTVLGVWAWAPSTHDWEKTRALAYADVFGPSQVETARRFDDQLADLKQLFVLPIWHWDRKPDNGWPCRLKDPTDRAKALEIIEHLEELRHMLTSVAPVHSILERDRLQTVYLEPMEKTLVYARRMTQLEYPEYTLADDVAEIVTLLKDGRREQAERALAKKRQATQHKLALVAEELKELKGIDQYVDRWKRRFATLETLLETGKKQ